MQESQHTQKDAVRQVVLAQQVPISSLQVPLATSLNVSKRSEDVRETIVETDERSMT